MKHSFFAIFSVQGYKTNYAIITSENSVSLDFHRKLGYIRAAEFENCGYKFGRWYHVLWMKKQLSERSHSPSDILPFALNRFA